MRIALLQTQYIYQEALFESLLSELASEIQGAQGFHKERKPWARVSPLRSKEGRNGVENPVRDHD